MYRRLLRQTLELLTHWQRRPFSAFALCIVVLTAVGGPAICVLDCWLHDLRAAQRDPQGLHQHHNALDEAAGSPGINTNGARHEQHHSDNDGNAPSALTIAVVLVMLLLFLPSWVRRQISNVCRLGRSLAIPPPPRPPRCFNSLALAVV